MNKNTNLIYSSKLRIWMIKIGLIAIFPFLFSSTVFAEFTQGMTCNQSINDTDGLVFDAIKGANLIGKEYRKADDSITIGKVNFSSISYLFVKDQFYGISVDITSKTDFNHVIRFFNDKYGTPSSYQKYNELVWYTESQVFVVGRFTTHLAQVQIRCRDMYEEIHNLKD